MSLTVKVRQDRDLSRSEVEVGVDDPDAAEGVLIALGQQHVVTVDKVRVSGHLDGATVTVDDVIGLGTFVECEILTDETSASPATRLDALTATIGQHVGMVGERIDKGYDRLLLERGSAAL
jgi:predicted adenylyl cyclase CyaB